MEENFKETPVLKIRAATYPDDASSKKELFRRAKNDLRKSNMSPKENFNRR